MMVPKGRVMNKSREREGRGREGINLLNFRKISNRSHVQLTLFLQVTNMFLGEISVGEGNILYLFLTVQMPS